MTIKSIVDRPMVSCFYAVHAQIGAVQVNPSLVKKVLQIAIKLFALHAYYGGIEAPAQPLADGLKEAVSIIDMHSSFKNIKGMTFWVTLFADPALASEQEGSAKSLPKNRGEWPTPGEALDKFQWACFTAACLGSNLLTLQRWGVIPLSQRALTIGFCTMSVPLSGPTLGVIASVGLTIALGRSSYELFQLRAQPLPADKESGDDHPPDGPAAIAKLASTSVDLVATALPLVCVLSPATLLGLSLLSNGVGLTRLLVYG